ncbi:MAG TPA: type II toxin-antitoxin system Phd/YefM family antitoxin [Candidatus Dormibacteraeota bacterium]|nr:type II toxin-antitoxin system Phd/YefM family antitoxin [Candidatus Dormibacteraeota bacterium]
MATSVNIYEAKTHLSQLLDRVARGEEIVLARAGRPVARLVPIGHRTEPRVPGAWRGLVHLANDFDELPPEVAAAFRGEGQ